MKILDPKILDADGVRTGMRTALARSTCEKLQPPQRDGLDNVIGALF
jgi:hypothetical protein